MYIFITYIHIFYYVCVEKSNKKLDADQPSSRDRDKEWLNQQRWDKLIVETRWE